MRKSILSMAALSALVLLPACSSDEIIGDVQHSDANAIGFNVVGTNASTTKAVTPITPSNLTAINFDVLAFFENGDCYMGKSETDSKGRSGIEITHSSGTWDYVTAAQKYYWPEVSKPLNFYAVAPSSAPLKEAYWSLDKYEIGYASMDATGYETFEGHDLMLAMTPSQTKQTNSGKVKLIFKHLLSQVVFKAKASSPYLNIDIKSVTICNVNCRGTYKIPQNMINWAPEASDWDVSPSVFIGDFNVRMDEVKNISGASVVTLSKEPWLFVPQVIKKWDMTHSISVADTQGQEEGYLKISCKVQNTDPAVNKYWIGSAEAYGTIYVPFGSGMDGETPISWQPGKRYVYTLNFGDGGYDANGEPLLTPILFEPDVEEWSDIESELDTTFPDRVTGSDSDEGSGEGGSEEEAGSTETETVS